MSDNIGLFCSFCLIVYIVLDFILLRKLKKKIKALEEENKILKNIKPIDISL